MKILVVSTFFESHRGGLEIVAGRIAREFQRAGHSVTWLACDASAPPPRSVCERAVPVRAFNGTERGFGIPFPLPSPAALATIRREVMRADVLLMHDAVYPTSVAAFLFARWSCKPLIVTQHIHTVPYRSALLRGLMQVLTRLVTRPILAGADQVVFISRITARAFADIGFRRPPRLIFNGLDTDIFRPVGGDDEKSEIRRQLGLPQDRPIALFVGRFVEKKGLHALRRAAEIDRTTTWAFAGWGHLDPTEWGLGNVRVFPELSRDTLAPLYRASDVFVLPSVGEGFPLVLQEALACGLPAVCGSETAQADDRVMPLLRTIAVDAYDPGRTAGELVAAARAAIAADTRQQAEHRSRLIRSWYSWPRAAELYLARIGELIADGVRDGAASQVLAATGTDR